jgi:hypothetical protein
MLRDKRGIIPIFAIICVLLAPAPLLAEEAGDAEMAAMMAANQPGEHHQHMAFMEGSWDVDAKFWMPGAPEPMEAKATAVYTSILGGRYLQQSYTSEFMGMPFEGLGTTGYDNMGKQYVATWTDNMNTAIMSETGQCDGTGKKTDWHGEIPDPASGKMIPTHSEQIVEGNDKFTYTSYTVGPDGTESPMMELVYTRK